MSLLSRQILPVLTALAGAVLLWGLIVRVTDVPAYLLPSPASVWAAGWGDRELLATHLAATITIALTGLACGAVCGVVVGVLLGLSATLRRAAEPLLIASQAIPPVVFAPILIALLGFGPLPKIIVVTLGAFFPVAISAGAAMRGADRTLVDLLVSMGASRWSVLRRVRLPGAVPAIVSGVKVAASYVVFSAIIAEWMGSSVGLGVYLQRSQASYKMDQLLAAVGVIAVLGVLLFWLSSLIGDLALTRTRATPNRKGIS